MFGFILAQVIKIVMTVAVPTLSYMGITYLKRRWDIQLSQDEHLMLMNWAKHAVTASEQQFKHEPRSVERSKLKQDAAKNYILTNAHRRGIQVNEEIVREFVEAAVHDLFGQETASGTKKS